MFNAKSQIKYNKVNSYQIKSKKVSTCNQFKPLTKKVTQNTKNKIASFPALISKYLI